VRFLLVLLAACGSRGEPAPAKVAVPIDAQPTLLDKAPQVIVGVIDGWDATNAELRRYERDGKTWREVGAPIAAVIGEAGAAWGSGLHPVDRAGPLKREGDGRAPAGAFRIGRAWSSPLAESWRCVDDPASAHYNQVLDSAGVDADWRSAEHMRIEPYRLVVELDHNPGDAPGGGSCIFLHVWDGADVPTAGCTAMAEPELAAIIAWLRPGAIYVLLPRPERDAVASSWGLP